MIKKIFRKIFGRKEIQINKWEFNNLSGFPIKIYLNACLSDTTLMSTCPKILYSEVIIS
jgi:hypothetical protein